MQVLLFMLVVPLLSNSFSPALDDPQVTTSSISSLARLPWGSKVATSSGDNTGPATSVPTLQLYEFGKKTFSVGYDL